MHHCHCHGTVQRHDGRGLDALKQIVEEDNFWPVCFFGPPCLAMDSRDRSLNREWSRVIAAKSFLHQRHSLSDLLSIPTAPILIFEKDEISIFIHARVAPGIVKKHQREET